MDLTTFVDVAIGLTVVFLGASLVVTVVNEYIAQLFRLRAQTLLRSLETLVADQSLRDELKKLPALRALLPAANEAPSDRRARKRRAPSYVDPKVLAAELFRALAALHPPAAPAAGGGPAGPLQSLRASLAAAGSPLASALATTLDTATVATKNAVDDAAGYLEKSLTMLGEGYKRNLQWISLAVSLGVAVALNVDSLAVAKHLYHDREARDAIAALGASVVAKVGSDQLALCAKAKGAGDAGKASESCAEVDAVIELVTRNEATARRLPIGWASAADALAQLAPCSEGWFGRLAGWLITAFSISLGSAFWFDLLTKFVSLRHGMKKPVAES